MNKFTIFTVILVISVAVVAADLALRDYFGENKGQTSVVNSALDAEDALAPEVVSAPPAAPDGSAPAPAAPAEAPVETPYTLPPPSSTVTPEITAKAGFTGSLEEKHFEGKVFQLLDITKIPVDAMSFYEISQNGGPVASVTEIALKDEIRALQMYTLLQNKTKPYIDLSLNETNAYGDRSFYINHAKKPNEAFLAVKIGKMIYSFAYVKVFHPEIKKLVQLLTP